MLNDLNSSTLNVPDAIDTIRAANVRNGKPKPVFKDHVCKEWYSDSEEQCKTAVQTRASDI